MNGYDCDSETSRKDAIVLEAKIGIARCNSKIEDANNMNIMLKQLLAMSDDFLLPYNLRPLLSIEEITLRCAQQISEQFNTIFASRWIWECHYNIEQQIEQNLSTINALLEDIKTYKKDIDFYCNQSITV